MLRMNDQNAIPSVDYAETREETVMASTAMTSTAMTPTATTPMIRRDFLKGGLAAGLICLGSLGSITCVSLMGAPSLTGGLSGGRAGSLAGLKNAGPTVGATATELEADASGVTQCRWGLAIDVIKLNERDILDRIAAACHTNHNVPQIDDPKTEVKWIWGSDFVHCFPEMDNEYFSDKYKKLVVPVLCNHCENPACVRVCPTGATFKRPDGITGMDYHRCIGCRYCLTACPYGARSFNFTDPRPYLEDVSPNYPTRAKGVAEKCNLCAERLDRGLAPYCVEASRGAMLFGDLADPASEIRKALADCLSIRRLPELGTEPSVFYLLRSGDTHA